MPLRPLALSLCGLLLTGPLVGESLNGPRVQAEADAPALRVGSWNVQWLGRPERRRGVAQKPEDIAEYVLASKVDVLCLNEVTHDGEGNAPRINRTLATALKLVSARAGQKWEHALFPKEEEADRDQLCGVAWNTAKVKLIGKPFRVPLRRGKTGAGFWNRHPHAVKFSAGEGKTDLVLIPVHMKSNYGGAAAATRQRAEEAKALVRSLGAAQNKFSDDDLVILGDFNCLKKDELTLRRYTLAGLKDLNGDDRPTWIKDARYDYAPFDRVLVPDDQPEFRGSAMRVFKHPRKSEADFRKLLSDHYMVIAEVRVLPDDD